MIYSEPLKEIVVKPAEVKELYLGKKGFNALRDFGKFINLEVLWMNENLITEVVDLDACTRIRKLYLQDNKITTLEGSIEKFKFLEVLMLHNNSLRDLQSVLDHLVHHRHLKQLNLLGNPCAEEERYREIVLSRLPLLEIFDRHVVTAKERITADQTLKIAPQLFSTPPQDTSISRKSRKQSTKTEMLVEKEAQKIKAAALEREKLAQEQKQQEREAQSAAAKQRAQTNHLPLPEALDFLKQRQQTSSPSTSTSLPLPSSSSPSPSPPLQKSSFHFETFANYTKDDPNNTTNAQRRTDARASPTRTRVTLK